MATASPAPHPALPRTASPATAVVCRLRPTVALHLRYRVSPQRGHTGSVRADTGCSAGLHGPGTPPPLSRSRARSALSVMIDEDGTRLLPCGVDAPRRQHGAQGPVLIRLVVRRRQRERVCLGCTLGHSRLSCASAGRLSPVGQAVKKVKPAAFTCCGLHTLRPHRFSAYAIITATGTPSPRPWARNAI